MHKFVENLLNGEKVEFKALGEVAELKRGKTITQKQITEGNIPVISGGQKPAYYTGEYNRDNETITVAGSGAYAGFLMFWNKPIFLADAFSIKSNLDNLLTKYIYYFLLNKQEFIYRMKKGAGVPHIYPKDMAKIKIPLPPLSAQKRIVEILDKFTNLTAELTTELTLRKKQFQYYRDFLLSENNLKKSGFQWKKLGEVAEIKTGQSVSKEKIANNIGEYPVINSGREPLGYINEWNTEDNPIGITTRGAGVGSITWQEGRYFRGNLNYSVKIQDERQLNVRFLYHLLLNLESEIHKLCTFSGIPALNASKLKKLLIPIPPLEKQLEIVNILDKFDKLTNSISEGLPKEIELREKQYRYYRDLLLNFEE